MGKRIEDWIGQYRHMDWAVLYMRLFAGGMMLFHNIGKMQDYNEIVNSYPIIMGIWVRMSALILSLGILLMFAWGGFGAGELEFVWLGVYVFLIISGGGLYAFDTALTPAKPKK